MGTVRVDRTTPAPTTQFTTEADWVSQSQAGNYSTVYIYIRAVNRGGTTSYSGYQGSQTGQVDGVGGHAHTGTLPSGYANGAQRWYEGPYGFNVGHDSEGKLSARTVRQIIAGWFNYNDVGSLPAPPRIPKPPTAPGKPVASEILPTSLRLTWTASTDNRGSPIDGYIVRRWDTADGSGPYVDSPLQNNLSRVLTGLTPGKAYTFAILAHNGSHGAYSVPSAVLVVSTLAPARIKVGGQYKYAIPYVKVAGVYKVGLPYIKVGGVYKQPT